MPKKKSYKDKATNDLVKAFEKFEGREEQFEAFTVLFKTVFTHEQIDLIIHLYEELEEETYQDEVTAWIVEDQSWMQAEKLKELLKERWR